VLIVHITGFQGHRVRACALNDLRKCDAYHAMLLSLDATNSKAADLPHKLLLTFARRT
jgi:hypothetical protein